MAANPIILIVAAVAAAVAAIILLYQKCEWFRDAVNAVWAQVKEFLFLPGRQSAPFLRRQSRRHGSRWSAYLTRFRHGGRALAVGGGFLRQCLDGHDGEPGAFRDCGYDPFLVGESFVYPAGDLAGNPDGGFGCLGAD